MYVVSRLMISIYEDDCEGELTMYVAVGKEVQSTMKMQGGRQTARKMYVHETEEWHDVAQ